MMPTSRKLRDAPSSLLPRKARWPVLLILIVIILIFAGLRVAVAWPNVASGDRAA
jgi:hypothetical protein